MACCDECAKTGGSCGDRAKEGTGPGKQCGDSGIRYPKPGSCWGCSAYMPGSGVRMMVGAPMRMAPGGGGGVISRGQPGMSAGWVLIPATQVPAYVLQQAAPGQTYKKSSAAPAAPTGCLGPFGSGPFYAAMPVPGGYKWYVFQMHMVGAPMIGDVVPCLPNTPGCSANGTPTTTPSSGMSTGEKVALGVGSVLLIAGVVYIAA